MEEITHISKHRFA